MHPKRISPSVRSALACIPFALAVVAAAAPLAHAADDARARSVACGDGPADLASRTPANLIRALYAIVSGPPGSIKDWARLRSLHAPGALITPTQHLGSDNFAAAPQPLEQFIGLNERLFARRGFFERELVQQVEIFGHIAQAWSSYETREQADGPVIARGVNSFQLLNDGGKWCVLSASWDTETASHPIPLGLVPNSDSAH
jgi:hypothetical protein